MSDTERLNYLIYLMKRQKMGPKSLMNVWIEVYALIKSLNLLDSPVYKDAVCAHNAIYREYTEAELEDSECNAIYTEAELKVSKCSVTIKKDFKEVMASISRIMNASKSLDDLVCRWNEVCDTIKLHCQNNPELQEYAFNEYDKNYDKYRKPLTDEYVCEDTLIQKESRPDENSSTKE